MDQIDILAAPRPAKNWSAPRKRRAREPVQTKSHHEAAKVAASEERRAIDDALRCIARDVMDPADKAAELTPALAEAIVIATHSGNFDYYLRHDTDRDIKRALFRLGCVGSRGPDDKRYWLGPYGSKVRLALLEDETS